MKRAALTLVLLAAALTGCASHYELTAPMADLARSGLVRDREQAKRLE